MILGPEMKSTGEVMGISEDHASSFAKAQIASKNILPTKGKVFISLAKLDKEFATELATDLIKLGFEIVCTKGTHKILKANGVKSKSIYKISEGRPNIADSLKNKEISLVINTSNNDDSSNNDGIELRQNVLRLNIPYFTTVAGARVSIKAIEKLITNSLKPKALQDYLS